MSTAHNHANIGDIAKTVLMPGDPLRAKFIAEKFLEDVVQFNTVRNMFGYTGTYKGKKVSVMGSGIGMPSIGVYSYELYNVYGVENIIRIGSAGSYTKELELFDILLVDEAWSESSYALAQNKDNSCFQYPSKSLNNKILETAKVLNTKVKIGRIHSSDIFYHEAHAEHDFYQEFGVLAVEMESFALFSNAKVLGKHAACLVTISDVLVGEGQHATSQERETSFIQMMKLALESAISE